MSTTRLIPVVAVGLLAPGAAVALAQPSNDKRQDAARVPPLPALLSGTTVDATAGTADAGGCAPVGGSVWYRLDPGPSRRVVVRLAAGGDLDATLDAYRRERSQQELLTCDRSDRNGRAALAFTARHGESYLIRVGRRSDSVPGDFKLRVVGAGGPRLPGPPLPDGGISGTLDRVQRTAQAWSVRLRTGVRYRVSMVHRGGGCLRTSVYRAGVKPRADRPALKAIGCRGYGIFTPRAGGRFSVLVRAAGSVHGPQRYHLQVAPAGRDDSAPGVHVDNYARVRGRLDAAGVDALDLFRFDVTRRSVLFLNLRTRAASAPFDLLLMDEGGRVVECACDGHGGASLHKGLHPGRFFIAARSRGGGPARYTLLRASRTITKTHLSLSGGSLAPGQPLTATVTTEPAVTGPVTVAFEQHDPLEGWQYVRAVRARVVNGRATVNFTPPSVGRWRATAAYRGTRGTAPSEAGFSRFLVAAPLHD